MNRHVFISHAREDKARIRPIIDQILKQNLPIWIDKPRQIRLHNHPLVSGIKSFENWAQSIQRNLNEAGVVVLFWSRHSVQPNRNAIHAEGRHAMDRSILVQVAIDPIFQANSPSVPFAFPERHILDLSEEMAQMSDRLKSEPDVTDLISHIREVLQEPAARPQPAFRANQAIGMTALFDTPSGGAPSSTALDDPLPYMVDRQIQQNHIVSNLCTELKQGQDARPCVFVMPGPDQERPDKFIVYLQHEVIEDLRDEGNLGREFEWDTRRIEWPSVSGSLSAKTAVADYLPHCRAAFGRALRIGGAGEAMANPATFAAHVAKGLSGERRHAILLEARITAGDEWSKSHEALMLAFLSWFETIPFKDIRTRVVLLFSLVAPRPTPRSLLAFRRKPDCYEFVRSLRPESFPRLRLVGLPHLDGIVSSDLTAWAEGVFHRRRAATLPHAAFVKEASRQLLKTGQKEPLDWVAKRLATYLDRPEIAGSAALKREA